MGVLDGQFAPKARQRAGSDGFYKCQSIRCDGCGSEGLVWPKGEPLPVKGMAAHFARRGWTVKKSGKHLCADCKKNQTLKGVEPMKSGKSEISPAARDARRMAHMLIEENYSATASAYLNGYSDERIAAESGVSAEWVASRREDEFGPLRKAPDLGAAREALGDAQAALKASFDALALALGAVKRLSDLLDPDRL